MPVDDDYDAGDGWFGGETWHRKVLKGGLGGMA